MHTSVAIEVHPELVALAIEAAKCGALGICRQRTSMFFGNRKFMADVAARCAA